MNQRPPIITFRASVPATASPDAAYAVLADLSTHLVWTGERAPDKNFRLLALEAPPAPATVGDRFSSKGANGFSMTFFDSSVVVEAERGTRFGFDTESRLERKHRPTWLAHFEHRYTITATGAGASIDYTCGVWPLNYLPWWLSPALRPMTHTLVERAVRKNMENLAALAEATGQRLPDGTEGPIRA
ncbi:MAG TPA: SRPBCC family protein [Actinomycetota bacterium]|nr:SRPBCC family protein [Actinomycetota bacterium]